MSNLSACREPGQVEPRAFDDDRHAIIGPNGESRRCSAIQWQALSILRSLGGRAISREDLRVAISHNIHSHNVYFAICHLRKKLAGTNWAIVSFGNAGYALQRIEGPKPARDVAPGESWAFADHRTLAQVFEDERAGI